MPVIVRDDLSLKSGYNVYDLDIIVQIKRTELEEYLSLKSLNSSVHVQRDCLRRLLQTCSTSSAAEGRRESFGQQWGGGCILLAVECGSELAADRSVRTEWPNHCIAFVISI